MVTVKLLKDLTITFIVNLPEKLVKEIYKYWNLSCKVIGQVTVRLLRD